MADESQYLRRLADLFDEQIGRANSLDLIEHLLCLSREETSWRAAVEHELANRGPLGKLLTGGARPADVWRPGLLRQRVVHALRESPETFSAFAITNPDVAALDEGDRRSPDALAEELGPYGVVLAAFAHPRDSEADDLAFKTEALKLACDALEAEETRPSDCGDATDAEQPVAEAHVRSAVTADESELARRLAESEAQVRRLEKELKALQAEHDKRKAEVGRKDRKLSELREAMQAAERACEQASQDAARFRAERDELLRKVARLEGQVASNRKGQRTVEDRRLEETQRLTGQIADLRERLQTSASVAEAFEQRVRSLEAQLADEAMRRRELEETLEAFGVEELLSSTQTLQSAVDALVRFKDAVVDYGDRKREREMRTLRLQQEAELERQRAEDAQRAQREIEEAWLLREKQLVADLERELFGDDGAMIDHIVIDGHNLILRSFRPDDEPRRRPWLERMVGSMARRLDERGWSTRIHLVFDTKSASNERGMGHGVRVYFHNNVTEGGADARIAALLEESNPAARYMVVSTDRQHVWADALEAMKADGRDIDLVQVELLARYLQALDDIERQGQESAGSS